MSRIATLVIGALFLPFHTTAQQAKSMSMELENIAAEYATCAAYYRLVFHGADASNRKDIATRYRQLEDDAMFYSLLLANEGRERDMAIQVTNARIEASMKAMKQEINDRNENIAILINKYGDTCVSMSKEPPPAAQKVLAKRLKEVSAEKTQ